MQKSLILAAALIAAGCAREPAGPTAETPQLAPADASAPKTARIAATGDVEWTSAEALPDDAFLRVRLLDVSRADAASAPIAEATYPVDSGSPVSFSLRARAEINPRTSLSVSAQISDGAALYFTSDTNNPVSPTEGARDMTITLVPVDPAPGTGSGGGPVTPVPAVYLCGDETFEIAIEAGAAYLTGADGATVTLDKLSGGAAAPQSFTNGRLTLFFDGSDMDGLNLRVARGRAAALDCVRSQ